jgi:hypothetical protein
MRVGNDSPSYQKAALGRKHVHPPLVTDLANVPNVDQNLAYANSRAMLDVDRFDTALRAGMPVLPARESDPVKPQVDNTLTPNSKVKKVEKDAQKFLCGRA